MTVARPFSVLRGRMKACEITQKDLARQLNLSMVSVSRRFSGHEEWRLGECYEVLAMLDVADKKISEYFPKGGRNE